MSTRHQFPSLYLGASLFTGVLAAIGTVSVGHAQATGPATSPASLPAALECPAALQSAAARTMAERFADEVDLKLPSSTTDVIVATVKRDLAKIVSQGRPSEGARADRDLIANLSPQTLAACFPRLGTVLAETDQAEADRLARRKAAQLQQQAERKAADRSFEDARGDFFAHAVPTPPVPGAPRLGEQNPYAEALKQLTTPPPDADQPAGQLVGAYQDYIFVRRCFDSRTGFALVYVTQEEIDAAKAQVKAIEDALLKRHPALDKDERWATANRLDQEMQRNLIVRMDAGQQAVRRGDYTAEGQAVCRSTVTGLRERYGKIDPAAKNLRKDF